MSRRPLPTNPRLLIRELGDPLPEDIREALAPCDDLSPDETAVLEAIARLDPDGVTAVAAREIARKCGWPVGGRVLDRLKALRGRGLLTYRERAPRTIRLTDAGWHATGRLTPAERIWRDGYAVGRASAHAQMTVHVSASTETLAVASH